MSSKTYFGVCISSIRGVFVGWHSHTVNTHTLSSLCCSDFGLVTENSVLISSFILLFSPFGVWVQLITQKDNIGCCWYIPISHITVRIKYTFFRCLKIIYNYICLCLHIMYNNTKRPSFWKILFLFLFLIVPYIYQSSIYASA